MSKYNNAKTEYMGIIFDSKMEKEYYEYLLGLQKKGLVKRILLQPVFELQPSYKKNGKHVREIKYVADFLVEYKDGTTEVIDIKGMVLSDFKLKMKIFEYKYPYTLKLITFSKLDGGWITLDELKKARKKRKQLKLSKK